MSENLRAYTKALYAVDGVVKRLKDSDWGKQSPNEEWTAKETLGHVIWGIRRMTAAATGGEPPDAQPEDEVAGDNPAETWQSAFDNILEALDQRGVLAKTIESPMGTMTIDEALGRFFADPLAHAWDLAKTAGIEAALPEELAERCIAILAAVRA